MTKDYASQDTIRVLHIVTTMNRGGLETMLMNYYRYINREKIQFDFLIHRQEESDYEKEIVNMGGRVYRLPRLNPFSYSYRRKLMLFFKKHPNYTIVHVHQDCLSTIALKICFKMDIPIRIAHSHSTSQDKNLKYLIKEFYKKKIPFYATHLFACGKEAGEWMFGKNDFKIIRNAIESKNYAYNEEIRKRVREQLNITNKELVVGHVGRFNYPKNHIFLIDIFYEICRQKQDSKLLLIGTGDLENEIKEKVNKLKLCNNVFFLGKVSNVNIYLQAMDIFLFPSHYEGVPVTLIEAQAAGLPIIKSDKVPDQCIITPNVFTEKLTKSPKQWADTVLEKSHTFKRANTLQFIKEKHYDIETNANILEDFYLSEGRKYD